MGAPFRCGFALEGNGKDASRRRKKQEK